MPKKMVKKSLFQKVNSSMLKLLLLLAARWQPFYIAAKYNNLNVSLPFGVISNCKPFHSVLSFIHSFICNSFAVSLIPVFNPLFLCQPFPLHTFTSFVTTWLYVKLSFIFSLAFLLQIYEDITQWFFLSPQFLFLWYSIALFLHILPLSFFLPASQFFPLGFLDFLPYYQSQPNLCFFTSIKNFAISNISADILVTLEVS